MTYTRTLLMSAIALILGACTDAGSSPPPPPPPPPPPTRIRVLNPADYNQLVAVEDTLRGVTCYVFQVRPSYSTQEYYFYRESLSCVRTAVVLPVR